MRRQSCIRDDEFTSIAFKGVIQKFRHTETERGGEVMKIFIHQHW